MVDDVAQKGCSPGKTPIEACLIGVQIPQVPSLRRSKLAFLQMKLFESGSDACVIRELESFDLSKQDRRASWVGSRGRSAANGNVEQRPVIRTRLAKQTDAEHFMYRPEGYGWRHGESAPFVKIQPISSVALSPSSTSV